MLLQAHPDHVLLSTLLDSFSALDLAKILGVPLLLALLVRFLNRRDKARDEAAAEATRVLKTRSEMAEKERGVLRADNEKNTVEHVRFNERLEEMLGTIRLLQSETQNLRMDMARSDTRDEGFKETMGRIDGQLGRLIHMTRTLS